MKNINFSNIQLISERIKNFSFTFDDALIKTPETSQKIIINAFQNFKEKKEKKPYSCILGLNIKFVIKTGRKILLKLETTIEGEFIGNPNMPEKDFRILVIRSGILNLIQIARAKIVSISSQFGFSKPIYIPLVNIKSFIKEEENKALKNLEE
ncbi:hypothetical protein X275_01065 [Marinitoga sp. 1197]|uniref:hypothetical protein n=1 Tax=Marinitoga sp. 1197 TaxID=1428449 RepID=UPI0006413B58|nr:hypothetical protein [Marinitoga sp. 1197]AJW76940.1 hypothetical protein UF08_51 [Marinitoga camini virus 1]KLO24020.1 hypothetical protein X275_01065 [Marinitoga sp. 1197]